MTIAGVAPWYQGRILLPVLGKVAATRYTDRVTVRLVSGQSAADFADHADNLAHGFGALSCRVRTARSGAVLLEFIRRDALAAIVPALPGEYELGFLRFTVAADVAPSVIDLRVTSPQISRDTQPVTVGTVDGLVFVMS